jgi:iron complex transport system substrate-binding protein/vitamin B12 transport system substrate-binding protein
MSRLLPWMLCLLTAAAQAQALSVRDATGATVTLKQPAKRIVALAPHAVEMLYAAGAGGALVAAVDYSDFPPAAKKLPRVGGLTGVSLENILRQHPDLVVAWVDGANPRDIARLKSLAIPVYQSRPLQLDDVAREIETLGVLAGHAASAAAAAEAYRAKLTSLSAHYAKRTPLTVFYQVSRVPIFTISNRSFIGQIIQLCGGRNVFGALTLPAPQVSTEAVVAARPQVMLADNAAILAGWSRWQAIPAVAHRTQYVLPADPLNRPGPRLVEGAAAVCRALDTARLRLGLTSP